MTDRELPSMVRVSFVVCCVMYRVGWAARMSSREPSKQVMKALWVGYMSLDLLWLGSAL